MLLKHKQKMRSPRLNKNNQGVTLIEVIAMIAVLSVVMAAVTGFVLTGAKMSVQVSNRATVSAREQTAVEFINKALYKATVTYADPLNENQEDFMDPENPENTETQYATLYLDAFNQGEAEAKQKAPQIYSSDGKVYYAINGNPTELCSGTIYFIKTNQNQDTNTVTYVLNGTDHTVHIRIGS